MSKGSLASMILSCLYVSLLYHLCDTPKVQVFPLLPSQNSAPFRDWQATKDRTFQLWRLSWKKSHITKFEKLSKKWGIVDSLNLHFVGKMQDLTRNAANPQDRINEQGKLLEKEHGRHLFNPFLALPGM